MRCPLLPFKRQLLGQPLARFQCPGCGECQQLAICGDLPPVILRNLIVPPVNRVNRMGVDEFKSHGIVARVLEIVLLPVEAGGVAEVAKKTDKASAVGLDLEYQALTQAGLTWVFRPVAYEAIAGEPWTTTARPHDDLIGLTASGRCARQFVPVIRKLFMYRRDHRSILFLRDLRLFLIDSAELNLAERQIARCRRCVSLRIRDYIQMGFACDDYVHFIVQLRN